MTDGTQRIVLVVNPVSGGGRGQHTLDRALPLFEAAGVIPEVYVSTSPAEPAVLARDAVRTSARAVVAVGGDGHAAAVASGLIGTDTPLGLIPAGSANDYAKSLGTPLRDLPEQIAHIVRGRVARVDTISVTTLAGEQRFLNVVGTGFDAQVAAVADRIRYFRGAGRYVLAIMRVLPTFSPAPLRLTVDGETHELRAMMVAIANGTSYGGGMRVAPDAKLDSGKLEICVVGNAGKIEFIRAFPRVFKGTHVTHPKVTMLRGSEIHVESDRRLFVTGDGEAAGELPVTIRVVPASLSVIVGGHDVTDAP